jgi:hypothetical protein
MKERKSYTCYLESAGRHALPRAATTPIYARRTNSRASTDHCGQSTHRADCGSHTVTERTAPPVRRIHYNRQVQSRRAFSMVVIRIQGMLVISLYYPPRCREHRLHPPITTLLCSLLGPGAHYQRPFLVFPEDHTLDRRIAN